jgi:predicted ester cyclase
LQTPFKCVFSSIISMNVNKQQHSSVFFSLVIGLMLMVCLVFLSPVSIEAQITDSSTITNTSDTEQQQEEEEEEENNKAIIIAFTNASNDRNYTAIEQYVAENIIEHRPGVMSGRTSTIQFLQSLSNAFPDFHINIDHIVAEDDKVVVFTTTNGTHQGEFIFAPGVPSTGKPVSFKTADMYRISNGQIVEHWDIIEILNMMIQIDAPSFSQPVPTLPDSPTNSTMNNVKGSSNNAEEQQTSELRCINPGDFPCCIEPLTEPPDPRCLEKSER